MSDFTVHNLLTMPLIEVRDVQCAGRCRHKGAIERAGRSQLVFPYRGTCVRHVGDEEAVADAPAGGNPVAAHFRYRAAKHCGSTRQASYR